MRSWLLERTESHWKMSVSGKAYVFTQSSESIVNLQTPSFDIFQLGIPAAGWNRSIYKLVRKYWMSISAGFFSHITLVWRCLDGDMMETFGLILQEFLSVSATLSSCVRFAL